MMIVSAGAAVLGAPVDLNHPATFLHWGWLQISVGNLIVIVVIVALFVLALFVPFPRDKR